LLGWRVKGLETLSNLIKLELRGNQIEVIKGLDNLENLKSLNLYVNKISEIESLKNIDTLHNFFIFGNPIFIKVQHKVQKLLINNFTESGHITRWTKIIELNEI